jgi:DNA sulfur modification protein DndB
MEKFICSGSILETEAELQGEYKIRKGEKGVKYIAKGEKVPEGWEAIEQKKRIKLTKPKSISKSLEDRVWCLLYKIGMNRMSSGNFKLKLAESESGKYIKQIDVVGMDEDVIFIVECKSHEISGEEPRLNKEICYLAANKDLICLALKNICGREPKNVQLIMATENIEWTPNNRIVAQEQKIQIFDENDISKLLELAEIAGNAAKYQLFNQVFYDKKIKKFRVEIPALESNMGGKKFYTFNMIPEHLLKIAFVHHRRKPVQFKEITDSYQRILESSRIKKIRDYIDKESGYFPGNIILSFMRKPNIKPFPSKMNFEEKVIGKTKPVIIELPGYYGSAWIIDGQHRLYGYANSEKRFEETLPVVAFIDLVPGEQARLFTDINHNQKSIDTNLIWDLYEDLYANSTDLEEQNHWAISKIAKELNKQGSLKGKIKIPKEGNKGDIDFKTLCLGLKRGNFLKSSKNDKAPFFSSSYEESIPYASIRLNKFLEIFATQLSDQWSRGKKGFIASPAGIRLLLAILSDLLPNLKDSEIKSLTNYSHYFNILMSPMIRHLKGCSDSQLQRYTSASTGRKQSPEMQAEFMEIIDKEKTRTFRSDFLDEWRKKQSEPTESNIKELLNRNEGQRLEIKGSFMLDINNLIRDSSYKLNKQLALEGPIRTIAAFLNSNGGDLIIGAVEKVKFPELDYDQRIWTFPNEGDYYLIGIEEELKGMQDRRIDAYENKIRCFIDDHLGKSYNIEMTFPKFKGKTICQISVERLRGNEWCYVDNQHFYRRDGNRNKELTGHQIDDYKNRRHEMED